MEYSLSSKESLRGDITIPPDKSLSHRAVMFNSLADGKANISNFLMGEDCLSTISVLRDLGVKKIKLMGSEVRYPSLSGFDLEVTEYLKK